MSSTTLRILLLFTVLGASLALAPASGAAPPRKSKARSHNTHKRGSCTRRSSRHTRRSRTCKSFKASDTNLALRKKATSSSRESRSLSAEYAVDGSNSSRWSSSFSSGQWWQVDLGTAQTVAKVSINWEAAYASEYLIKTSTDGVNFTQRADVKIGAAGWQSTSFSAVTARYVRIVGVTRATRYGISFWEAQVYATGDTTSPSGPPPSGGTTTGGGDPTSGGGTTTTGGTTTGGGPVTSPLIYGLNSVWMDDTDIKKLTSIGITWSRMEIDWDRVEPSPGKFDFSWNDQWVAAGARNGMTVLPELMNPPGWASGGWNVMPTDLNAWGNYVAHVVQHYGPGGDFWTKNPSLPYHPMTYFEVWNEPYITMFVNGNSNPQQYARLFKAAATAGKAANPQAKFLVEADTTGELMNGGYVEFIDNMYSAVPDLGSWIDGVAVHPYSQPRAPDYTAGDMRWNFRRIEDVHNRFLAHGTNKPFWITEIGWPTCSNTYACVSESTSATYTGRMFDIIKSEYKDWVQSVFLYNFRDPSSQDPSNMEDYFGLLRGDGSQKPVWNVVKSETGV
jgi:hypothetical protein